MFNAAVYENPIAKYKETLLQVIGASLLISFCSQIKIALPFTPVPITLQTFAVLLIGAKLGSKNGAAAILLYFVQVLMGLPVLAGGGSNPLSFFGPTGGYLIGFLPEAYIMGWFAEKINQGQPQKLFCAGLLAVTLQLGLGAIFLSNFVGWGSVIFMGVVPFIFGELLKVIAVVRLTTKG